MLTPQDISNTLEAIRGEPSPPLELQKSYGNNPNEIYHFFCGLKKDYRNAAHFWLTCETYMAYEYQSKPPVNFDCSSGHHFLQAGDLFEDFFSISLPGRQVSFESLSLERFSSELVRASAYLRELGEEVDYHVEGDLLQAVLEKVDPYEIMYTAIAETTTQYVALIWYSTD